MNRSGPQQPPEHLTLPAVSFAASLDRRLVGAQVVATTRLEVFSWLAVRAARRLRSHTAVEFTALFEAREEQLSTATPEGVAFPHALGPGIERTLAGVLTLAEPIRWDDRNPPIRLVLATIGPRDTPHLHVLLLADMATMAANPLRREMLLAAPTDEALLELLHTYANGAVR